MGLIILIGTVILLWSTALGPMLEAAEKRQEIEFKHCYHRFQLRSIKKYHGLFMDDPSLQGLSLDDIDKEFRVQQFYHDIGRS